LLPPKKSWRLVLNTSLTPPDEIDVLSESPMVNTSTYLAGGRSVVVLAADLS
jgi:hypothetical protein